MENLPNVQLIFVSGTLDPNIWKHQEKYFSRSCRVEKIGGKEFEEVVSDLEDMLENCDNAIVIGAEYGNHAVKEVEKHENIMTTVFTGLFDDTPEMTRKRYSYSKKALKRPKIFKKLFFKSKTDYRIIKRFLIDTDLPDFEVLESYKDKELDVPLKSSLTIYNQGCRFSTMEKVEELKPNSEIAIIDAGSFSFYEKPQEFNKALHDYLLGKKEFLEKRELVKAATENKSLEDFNKMRLKR